MHIPNFYLEPANYQVDLEELRYVRNQVFVVEQQIPADIEFDELDQHCHHVIARDFQRQPIATGRLSPEGKIGRMAVLAEWRGQGVGASLLRFLIEKARNLGLGKVTAHAQISALGFYEKQGFGKQGDSFLEAGIPHQAIELLLEPLENMERPTARPRDSAVQAEKFKTEEEVLTATQQLITQSRRLLCIYSQDLEYNLYGQKEIVEALKQFAINNRNAVAQIIIQNPENLRNMVHPVIELAQRLSSHFLIRTPVEAEDLQYLSVFVANDRDGYLFRPVGNRYEGHWSPALAARNRQLREEFERVWQRSRACSEFRALNL